MVNDIIWYCKVLHCLIFLIPPSKSINWNTKKSYVQCWYWPLKVMIPILSALHKHCTTFLLHQRYIMLRILTQQRLNGLQWYKGSSAHSQGTLDCETTRLLVTFLQLLVQKEVEEMVDRAPVKFLHALEKYGWLSPVKFSVNRFTRHIGSVLDLLTTLTTKGKRTKEGSWKQCQHHHHHHQQHQQCQNSNSSASSSSTSSARTATVVPAAAAAAAPSSVVVAPAAEPAS